MVWAAGHVAGEKGPHVVLVQEAALVGSQRKGELPCDFSYKALGFFPQRIVCAGYSGRCPQALVVVVSCYCQAFSSSWCHDSCTCL